VKFIYFWLSFFKLETEFLLLANINAKHFLVLSHQLVPMKFDLILKLNGTKFVVPCFYHQRELLLIIDYCHVVVRWIWRICISRIRWFVCLNERIAMHRFVFERLVRRCDFRKRDRMRILLSTFFGILMWILRRSSSVSLRNLNINLYLLITYKGFEAGGRRTLLNDLSQYLPLFVSV